MPDKKREETGNSVAHSIGHKLPLKTNEVKQRTEDPFVDASRIAFLLA
jgi:hypothetical protein